MYLSATVDEQDEVTFVSLVVTNDADEPRRFRVATVHEGPLWPPRVHGVVAPGWDEAGYEGVLGAGGSRSLGYATPASPADPPAEIAWTEPAGDSEPAGRSPAAILRSRGDPRPPADVTIPDYFQSQDGETPDGRRGERP